MSKQFNRQRRHNNNNRSRSVAVQQITRFTILDSSGPLGKLRGTALQLAEKYQMGAKDAQTQGDDVLFQTCQQYADHYLRLQNIAIENEQAKTKSMEQSEVSEENKEVDTEEKEEQEESQQTPVIVGKKTLVHHKKTEEDDLSIPVTDLR